MSNHTLLSAAIEARNPESVARQLAFYGTRQRQALAVLDILYDCTAGELKRINTWASDWLSDANHQNLRARDDARWQAVNTVYALSTHAMRETGLTWKAEVQS